MKKVISILLAVFMVYALIPLSTSAADAEGEPPGESVTASGDAPDAVPESPEDPPADESAVAPEEAAPTGDEPDADSPAGDVPV
ncbi:MAG: hypothetical protein LBD92_00325, partial [Oscillospiraceae bacterium]|nr:hypothetical protein [Oscillospiraceae bacterium]